MNRPRPGRSALQITPAGVAGSIVVVIVAAVCVRLGFWQLDRRDQRQALNAALEARLTLPVLAVESPPTDSTGLTFRPARAAGTYDDARTIVLPGRSFQGMPGVHVLTPLQLATGAAVLVNRGWVPAPDAATVDFAALTTSRDTAVEGMLLPFPGRGESRAPQSAAAGDSAFRRVWYAIDEAALRAQFPYPLGAVTLQLMPREHGVRLPRPLPPPELDEGPHLGYAIQWFSFAVIAVVGWIALVLSRERGARRED